MKEIFISAREEEFIGKKLLLPKSLFNDIPKIYPVKRPRVHNITWTTSKGWCPKYKYVKVSEKSEKII